MGSGLYLLVKGRILLECLRQLILKLIPYGLLVLNNLSLLLKLVSQLAQLLLLSQLHLLSLPP